MFEAKDEPGFVELNRTFHELSKSEDESDHVEIRHALHLGVHLSWADLIQEFRVVVLSEAGTGKTEEIRHLAMTLQGEGKAAFFLRLEHIPNDFEVAFEVGTFEDFTYVTIVQTAASSFWCTEAVEALGRFQTQQRRSISMVWSTP